MMLSPISIFLTRQVLDRGLMHTRINKI